MTRTAGVRAGDTDVSAESVDVDLDSIRLHTVQAGPEDGPLVVLLHGFPEFWYGWRHQIQPLANAGFRVVVPDQRGYNASDKPGPVNAYRLERLTRDVEELVETLAPDDPGTEPAADVVGHDWGAFVAWWLALHYPERVRRLGVLNVPHPTVFRQTLRHSWDQRLRSWYVAAFQVPRVPEVLFQADDYRLLSRTLRRTSRPGTFSEADLDLYRRAWRQPGAVRGMVNWYRAIARDRPQPRRTRVDPETLVLWGANDQALKRKMARESVNYCTHGRLAMFEDATHWVQHEEPVAVADRLLEFLAPERERP
jgi:pimeloyl-ACP methyl ester carboxylesterase